MLRSTSDLNICSYARLDAWLSSQAAPANKKQTESTKPCGSAAPAAALDGGGQQIARAVSLQPTFSAASELPTLSNTSSVQCADTPSIRPLDLAVLLLLWVLSSGLFAVFAWAHIPRELKR
jgi:hypothetical protein